MPANVQCIVSSFKTDLLNGLHAFGASVIRAGTTKDSFKAALYHTGASMGAATTAYSVTAEVTNGAGTGYTAGGVAITNGNAPALDTTTAHWTPSASFQWAVFTSDAAFDAVLIYNATASGKNAVSVHVFGAQSITAGTFTLTMPTDDGTTGLIRLA